MTPSRLPVESRDTNSRSPADLGCPSCASITSEDGLSERKSPRPALVDALPDEDRVRALAATDKLARINSTARERVCFEVSLARMLDEQGSGDLTTCAGVCAVVEIPAAQSAIGTLG